VLDGVRRLLCSVKALSLRSLMWLRIVTEDTRRKTVLRLLFLSSLNFLSEIYANSSLLLFSH